jgi:hypothetical protein
MAEETKQNQPNLFTDPNFVGMSKDGRFVVSSLLTFTQTETDVPGLFLIGESQSLEENRATLDRFIAYWAKRANATSSPSELLAELKVFGWLQVDVSRNLVRIAKAPLFMPPANRGVAARWAAAISKLPRCEFQDMHLQTLRQACSHDAELSMAFMSCLIDGDNQYASPYGE